MVVLPDNDEPGKKHAASVTASLANVASRVRVLHLPDLSDKGDPFDWVAKGGTAAKLWGLIEGQREQTKVNGHADPFNLVCLSGVEPVPVDWLWPGYLAIGKLTLLGGDPDSGKSLICTDAAARQSKGIHWPRGPRSRVGSTIFICSEDGIADTIRPRAEAAGADLDQLHVFERRKVRIGRLTIVGQVAGELGRLYRQARRGDVAVADASRLATILAVMRQCLEASELERRIAEMEVALAPATSSVVQLRSRK